MNSPLAWITNFRFTRHSLLQARLAAGFFISA
jgi:hypothetical protein